MNKRMQGGHRDPQGTHLQPKSEIRYVQETPRRMVGMFAKSSG
jgi:hypothetical protein